ncbi:hypothetical protein tpqmel_0469 [Candidatus Gastranaerophilus sp. (ex Termes propinquus)]|nr:hypothetical protein tpqmel_0469 [Candidatus Gastranaerophilus sp. (ex Termes propinquus)]
MQNSISTALLTDGNNSDISKYFACMLNNSKARMSFAKNLTFIKNIDHKPISKDTEKRAKNII